MGVFLLQNLQKNLFPYQKSLDEMGRKLGVGSRMPGWAKKAAMSEFQPVPAPEEKKKKKDKDKNQKNKQDNKKGGKKERAKASGSKAVPEAGRHQGKRTDGAGTPETAERAQDSAANSANGQAGQAEYTEVSGQQDSIPKKGSGRQCRPGGAMSQESLRNAVAWSVILGEPAARKRRQMRRGSAAAGHGE